MSEWSGGADYFPIETNHGMKNGNPQLSNTICNEDLILSHLNGYPVDDDDGGGVGINSLQDIFSAESIRWFALLIERGSKDGALE